MLIFPFKKDMSRRIIHIDMDAFFAAIEQRDNSSLVGKPVVIARNPQQSGGRGVVSTASYEARKFGVHSAMSAKEAYELCPQAIFISGNYQKYTEVSHQVREIFHRYTDTVQMASIDEAYLDVTENKLGIKSAVKIARLIQHDIFTELHLTCSAGVSYNKFLAKVGSDFEKPHGLTVIKPEEALDFLAELPIEKFHGVGKATVPKLHDIGIYKGADLQQMNPLDLANRFGVFGWSIYLKGIGIHDSEVYVSHNRKSVGKERTYGKLIYREEDALAALSHIAEGVANSLQRHELKGNIVVLKLRYSDFTTFTRRKSFAEKINTVDQLYKATEQIMSDIKLSSKGIRLLGLTVTGFGQVEELLDMLD